MQISLSNVVNIKSRDLNECVKVVFAITKAKDIKQNMQTCMKKGGAKCIKDKNKIAMFAFWFYGENGVSLSYFWVDEQYRKKSSVLVFFYALFSYYFYDKDVYINADNVWDYKDMLEPTTNKTEYKFKKNTLYKVQKAYFKWQVTQWVE